MRKLSASLCVTALLALGVVSTAAAGHNDGLVVVEIDNVLNNNDVNVVVPIQAAAAIAANVCGVSVPINLLAIDQGTTTFTTTCNSASRAFNTGTLDITNN